MNEHQNLIAGKWVGASTGETFENINPANPTEAVGTFPSASAQDAQDAIQAAQDALPDWAATPPPKRGAVLYEASQIIDSKLKEIATALVLEEGKTIAEASGEVARARDIFRYYAAEGWRMGGEVLPNNFEGELIYTKREPLGIVSVITPWNFPVAIPAWKIAPALVYGNTVIFKPASLAPQVGMMLVEALVEAGIPAGVINFVTGSGSIVGEELVAHPGVSGVSFTGSHQIGVSVYAKGTENGARVQCEMGGKNPLVVLKDADLSTATDLAVKGGFGFTGQACTATSRVIVEEHLADQLADSLTKAARKLIVGDGLDEGTQMGPAVSKDQLETDLDYIRIGQSEGATLLTGGDMARDGGFYVQPTVFDNVRPEMRIAQEEIFGPVISLIRVANFDEAMEVANSIGFGLSAGIVTGDLTQAHRFADRIEAGVVKINSPTTGVALQAPFGGFKQSSVNTFKEQGQAAIEFYTRTKTVYVNYR